MPRHLSFLRRESRPASANRGAPPIARCRKRIGEAYRQTPPRFLRQTRVSPAVSTSFARLVGGVEI